MTFPHGGNLHKIAEAAGRPQAEILDFSANINPIGPPEALRSVLCRTIDSLSHYPDPEGTELSKKLASRFQVSPERIILGNGSTEILYALPRVLNRPRAVLPVPSYIDYATASRKARLTVEEYLLRAADGFAIDWQALAGLLLGDEIVFIGQPNNPTGNLAEPDRLLELVRSHPQSYFVIDESFADFVDGYQSPDSGETLANLITVRSLTKFYAIPGLRLGFAIVPTELSSQVRDRILPWSVNTLAQAAGIACLDDEEYGHRTREYVTARRLQLEKRLTENSHLKVYPGVANYLLVQLLHKKKTAHQLAEQLLKDGIAIRVCDNFQGMDEYFFRIAVRQGDENEQLCRALEDILGEHRMVRKPRKPTPAIMLQGTASNAGKSVLTAALGRIFLQDGINVAPFKAQNMSLNSFVTRDGLEMGRAQVVQAQACRLDPDIRMNPVLLKPSSDVGSQIIVNGRPVSNMNVDEYVAYKKKAWQAVTKAYDSLAGEYDLLVLEGAGSPAEINLRHHDIVNMAMARYASSPVFLVGDIDRGGVFASFVGTLELMADWERNLVGGFIVNRFRGQASLLRDAYVYTEQRTARPVLGTIPYLPDLGLPEEDSVSFKAGLYDAPLPANDHVEIVLIDLPHISNFTDMEPLLAEPDVFLRVVRNPRELDDCRSTADALILPGSKNVINDLAYLEESGLGQKIRKLAVEGETEIIGICGGFQMLGHSVADPHGLESSGLTRPGLGLLDLQTSLAQEKTLTRQTFTHIESGLEVHGYEIHHGISEGSADPLLQQSSRSVAGAVSNDSMRWGSYLHGIFDADRFRRWFINRLRQRRGLAPLHGVQVPYDLELAFERLANTVREHLDMNRIYRFLNL
jgi:cobyric acid synthase CobQ/L-threonine-O-3-phosphate decarboxylase